MIIADIIKGQSVGTGRCHRGRDHSGIILMITLVLLVVLSLLGYIISSRLMTYRHRNQYIMDYQTAVYARDSAVKYALTAIADANSELIDRPNEPDFSDLFALDQQQYREYLANWITENARSKHKESSDGANSIGDRKDANDANSVHQNRSDANGTTGVADVDSVKNIFKGLAAGKDVNEANQVDYAAGIADINDPDSIIVPGPYGPPWPLVFAPVEFEIGPARVRIEVEDENAKYSLLWAMMDSNDVKREAEAGFKTFCEWMKIDDGQVEYLQSQLKDIAEIKAFKFGVEPAKAAAKEPNDTASLRRRRRRNQPAAAPEPEKAASQQAAQTAQTAQTAKTTPIIAVDFAKIFHSSLIDTEFLAKPTLVGANRKESALKYIGLWASTTVNVNSAPRHVLEAAFTFGGDADKIAAEIIRQRRIKPFKEIEDLRKALLKYGDAIRKCEKYIATSSRCFTIRVTATVGVARSSAIVAINKDKKNIERIAMITN